MDTLDTPHEAPRGLGTTRWIFQAPVAPASRSGERNDASARPVVDRAGPCRRPVALRSPPRGPCRRISSERASVESQAAEIEGLEDDLASLTDDIAALNDEAGRLKDEGADLRAAIGDCRDAAAGGKRMLAWFVKVGLGRASLSEGQGEFGTTGRNRSARHRRTRTASSDATGRGSMMVGRAPIGVAALTAVVAIVAVAVAVLSLGKASRLERLDDLRVRPSASPAVDAFDPARVAEIGAASSVTVFSGSGLGTGFAFAAGDDGGSIVVTNFHVVEKGRSQPFRTVQVHVGDERLAAHPYRWDADLDIALLDVEAQMPILEAHTSATCRPRSAILPRVRRPGLRNTATVESSRRSDPRGCRPTRRSTTGTRAGHSSTATDRCSASPRWESAVARVSEFAIDIRQVCELDAALACEPSA